MLAWKEVSSWPKAPVSDDAADTVIDPVSAAAVVEVAVAGELEELPTGGSDCPTAAMATAARMLIAAATGAASSRW